MYSTSDFLINHAYRNVWCAPTQDRQYIVAPQRLTTRRGTLGGLRVGMRYINLPTPSDLYHVFVFGDIPPMMVGMDTISDTWVGAKAHCNRTSLLIDIYTSAGIHIPTHRAFFLYDHSGTLVVAIQHTPKCANIGDERVYFRWRSNAWFDTQGVLGTTQGIEIDGTTVTSSEQLYGLQVVLQEIKQRLGAVFIYVNGKRVRDLSPATAVVGDVVEYVYDGSVREVREIAVKDLLGFDSLVDQCGKFLVPGPGLGDTIDYLDDIDVYLIRYSAAALYTGVFYHRNHPDAIRMVTHRDYSLNSAYVQGLVEQHGWSWSDDIRVEVIVRHSGLIRELVDEHHRIKELYKLPEAKRLKAMIGEDAVVSTWTASELERSEYLQLMRMKAGTLDRPMVQAAYGYNAISKLINNTPVRIPATGRISTPHAARNRATFYEYDESGRLLGWHRHNANFEYLAHDPQARYVEVYPGHGGIGLCTAYNRTDYRIASDVEYRFYVSPKDAGDSNRWQDVTGDTRFYQIVNNVVQWKVDLNHFHTAIRNSLDFLAYDLTIDRRDDLLAVTIRVDEVRIGLIPTAGIMEIPPGELDVILNGADLVAGIDYYVQWPMICVVTKHHLNAGRLQNLHIRGRGFCRTDMRLDTKDDTGFVHKGRLSRNAHFHLRDDRVTRISIGGSLYLPDEVAFAEDGALTEEDSLNGYPYRIHHPIIPMAGVIDGDTYAFRTSSEMVDREIEDYLTLHLPEESEENPNPITTYYRVFSPLCSKLIFDMLNGIFSVEEFKGEYSNDFLRERLRGYDWILPFDPALIGVDERYVVIHPHAELNKVGLNAYQYRLLQRAIDVMLDGKVDIVRHIEIVPEGEEYPGLSDTHNHLSAEV